MASVKNSEHSEPRLKPYNYADKELERIEAMTASPETKMALRQAANIEYEEEVEKIVNTS